MCFKRIYRVHVGYNRRFNAGFFLPVLLSCSQALHLQHNPSIMAKTILITGANGNLGTAVVKKFLDEDYKVIGVDHSGSHLGFASNHPQFELHAVNLADEVASDTFVKEAISLYKKIDGALLLAGGFAMGDIAATDGAALKKMFSLNFETAYYLARPLFQHMMESGYGRIVLVGARPAIQPDAGKNLIAYALSKSLLIKLADLLNEAAKGKNVVVSVIAPSTIDTPVNRADMPKADFSKWVAPAQIAEVLEFICSGKGDPLRSPLYKIYGDA
jgi:NAD(P)-dependent dehydrogenase (short-subunit alcohol dehydrogenase family)